MLISNVADFILFLSKLYEVCESNNGNLTTLSMKQRDVINKLAVEMDYSILKETNRSWLLHNLLQDAVTPHLPV